jgi:hypothetical protein
MASSTSANVAPVTDSPSTPAAARAAAQNRTVTVGAVTPV